MPKAEWYVVQVQTGHEQQMCELIESLCAQADLLAAATSDEDDPTLLLQECFSPRFRTQRKRMGRFVDVEHPLLPGYVIAVTHDPARLAHNLRLTREYTHLLAVGETYVPLSKEERLWLERQTAQGNRVVPMSIGYRRGDTFVATEGPLVGHEWMVDRVSRANSMAHLELHVGQMTIRTTVGLAILPEPADTETTPDGGPMPSARTE